MGIFTGSTPNQHRTASNGQTGLLLQQQLIIKTEKLSFIAPHQHSFMIKLLGLAVNHSVPKTKQGPCRIGRRSLPFRDLQFTASTWQYFACYYARAGEMCSGTTFRHSATLSKLYFFFDSLQYDFSLTWNKIPFHACAY